MMRFLTYSAASEKLKDGAAAKVASVAKVRSHTPTNHYTALLKEHLLAWLAGCAHVLD
jgi:hypothetical protein